MRRWVSADSRRLTLRHLEPPALPDDLGEGADDRRHDRVAGPRGHRAVEAQVVAEEGLGLLERREQPRDLVRHRGPLLAGRARGRQGGRADLEQPPRLVHLVEREAVQRRQELERRPPEPGRAPYDERPGASARGDDAHRLQGSQAGAQRGAADAQLERKLSLGRQAVPGAEPAGLDLAPHVLDHLGADGRVARCRIGTTCPSVARHAGMRNTTPASGASTGAASPGLGDPREVAQSLPGEDRS